MSLKQIIEGWKNHILPQSDTKDLIQATSKERLDICKNCPFHSRFHETLRLDDHCTACGCTLAAKTKCLSCSCPQDKWGAVIPEENGKEI